MFPSCYEGRSRTNPSYTHYSSFIIHHSSFTLKITLLGTGTSQGVPVIGCGCAVCRSTDARDKRLRSSALVTAGEVNILIDAGPDFRQQMLRAGVSHLDAIILTHEHNDHVIGLDDIRPLNFRSGQPMRVFALPRVASEVRKRFEYIFGEPIPGLPRIELIEIDSDRPLVVNGLHVVPIGVQHGRLPILGYRFETLTYLTDVKSLLPSEMQKIIDTTYLITSALHHEWHPTHMNLEEALALVDQIRPKQAWLTHISHHMGLAAEAGSRLPEGVSLAYDGLEIPF